MDTLDEKVAYERFLYGYEKEIVINDMEFCLDRIVILPQIRPHKLELAVRLSIQYCLKADFKKEFLAKSIKCPVLIFQLFKRGVFVFEEIKPYLESVNAFLLSYYFRKEIDNFDIFIQNKTKPSFFDETFIENPNNIDLLIEYGFWPSSIEYCLKYDDIDELQSINIMEQVVKWSPFEWSFKPSFYDVLAFSGFFGSIKCFKFLLMNGFVIETGVISMVVCSGCLDIVHMCSIQEFINDNICYLAIEFCQPLVLEFMIENGANLNKDKILQSTQLHSASEFGHLSIVEYLVNRKADINEKDILV